MEKFIKGIELSKLFFTNLVQKIIEKNYPDLNYSVGIIGYGSEALGFDTEISTDHHWGPRLMIFFNEDDFHFKEEISNLLSNTLPNKFMGYSTNFGTPDEIGVQLLKDVEQGELINHRIEFFTIKSFFEEYIGINPYNEFSVYDWLTFSEQKLRAIKYGTFFKDEIGFKKIQNKFLYYPNDIWLYILASEWSKIGQEEPFVGRCGDVNDELGSKVIAVRLVNSIMRLCFLMEKEYAPYSKWFGTAFSQLSSGKVISQILNKIISSETWKEREKYFSIVYEKIVSIHNKLEITKPMLTQVTSFHGRPYLVIHGENFVKEISRQIKNKEVLNIKEFIGSVNQISYSTDLLENDYLLKRMKNLYK